VYWEVIAALRDKDHNGVILARALYACVSLKQMY